jgi:hypothetical protein
VALSLKINEVHFLLHSEIEKNVDRIACKPAWEKDNLVKQKKTFETDSIILAQSVANPRE